jgi:hypothetical protein
MVYDLQPIARPLLDQPPNVLGDTPDHFEDSQGLMNLTAHLHFVTTPPGHPSCKPEASALIGVSG